MNAQMRNMLPMLVIGALVAVLAPRIGSFGILFVILAIAGWIVVIGWILDRMGRLPEGISRLFNQTARSQKLSELQAEQKELQRRRLIELVTAEHVRTVLDEALIGQSQLAEDVGQAVEIFLGKKSPAKPLSIVVSGPTGSGRTSFAEAVGIAVAPETSPSLTRIDCASDSSHDLVEIGGRIAGHALPVLLIDNFDKLGTQRHGDSFVSDLTRLIDQGIVDGKQRLRHAIVVLTVMTEPVTSVEAYREIAKRPEERPLIMREYLHVSGKLPADLLSRIDVVGLLKPLEDIEQIIVVWEIFRGMARREHEITILEGEESLGEGIEDFLLEARERWLKAGVSGAREAARFVAAAADQALVQASRSGASQVRATWDKGTGRIRLEPVEPELEQAQAGAGGIDVETEAEAAHSHPEPILTRPNTASTGRVQ
ncbi:MAG TPA: AAA family ATPase [Aliidongia sp.]|nr:AAA family ATPase [Aliidongia sp.]